MTLADLLLLTAILPAGERPVVYRSRLCGVEFTYPPGWKVRQMEHCNFEVTVKIQPTADPKCPLRSWASIEVKKRGLDPALAASIWSMEGADAVRGRTWEGRTSSISTRCHPRDFPKCVDYPSVQCDVRVAIIGNASKSAEINDEGGMDDADFASVLQGIAFLGPQR